MQSLVREIQDWQNSLRTLFVECFFGLWTLITHAGKPRNDVIHVAAHEPIISLYDDVETCNKFSHKHAEQNAIQGTLFGSLRNDVDDCYGYDNATKQ